MIVYSGAGKGLTSSITIGAVMMSVPPRGSGWVRWYSWAIDSIPFQTHPLPRGGTDLIGRHVLLRASAKTASPSVFAQLLSCIIHPLFNPIPTVQPHCLNAQGAFR